MYMYAVLQIKSLIIITHKFLVYRLKTYFSDILLLAINEAAFITSSKDDCNVNNFEELYICT